MMRQGARPVIDARIWQAGSTAFEGKRPIIDAHI